MSNKNKKICIVVSSLGKGGAERSSATLSKMLYSFGHEVHVVSVLNQIDYDFAGTILNLGELKDKNDSIIGRYKRFVIFKKFLKAKKFDLVIDGRSKPNPLKEFFIHRLLYKNQNLIHVVHSSKLDTYLTRKKRIFNLVFGSVKVFVCVSRGIKDQVQKIYNTNKVRTIYNAVNIPENELDSTDVPVMDFEYILYCGRLEDKVKNVSLLIDAFKISKLAPNGIKLLILGDGSDKPKLVKKVETLELQGSVMFFPYKKNPFPYIKKAKFTVLTSRYEGFPMVVSESLALGVPVIAVNCPGPAEIIENGYNGLLVENFKEEVLAKAMNSFIFDKDLYQICKSNTKKSVEKFSFKHISKEWDRLIHQIE